MSEGKRPEKRKATLSHKFVTVKKSCGLITKLSWIKYTPLDLHGVPKKTKSGVYDFMGQLVLKTPASAGTTDGCTTNIDSSAPSTSAASAYNQVILIDLYNIELLLIWAFGRCQIKKNIEIPSSITSI